MSDTQPPGPRVAHVGIAVRSIAELHAFYRTVLGMSEVDMSDSDGARIAGFAAGDVLVELLEAETPDSPIGRFIDRRGPGIHHICFAMTDLDDTLERETVEAVERRLAAVQREIAKAWKARASWELVVEREVFWRRGAPPERSGARGREGR